MSFDIPLIFVSEVGDGDAEKRKQFVMQTGMLSSALEHATPEQMFASQDPADPKPDAISAVKALQKASAAGQRIYHLTQENMGSTLGAIHHDTATILEIRSALLAGKEVITHTNAVSVPGWSGAGYIILDPETGVGAYKIAGGGNGSFSAADKITMILGLYTEFKEAMAELMEISWKTSTIGKFLHLTAKFFGLLGFGIAAIDIASTCNGVGIYATMYIYSMLTIMTLVMASFITNPFIGFIFAAAASTAIDQLIDHLKDTIVCKT